MGLFGKKKEPEETAGPAPAAWPQPQPGQDVSAMMQGPDQAVVDSQMARADQLLGKLGKSGFGGKLGAARIAGAQANLAYSQQMMTQFQGMGGGAAVGSPSWIDAVLHPQADFMRECTCGNCGGQKKLPSPTAYMYCDYCGSLADYDFRKVVGGSSATTMPDPAYVQWINKIGQDKRAAKESGDQAGYQQLETQFYDDWITRNPKSVSQRCGDPSYRQKYLDYCVASSMATAFDPGYRALEEELKQAVTRMVYGGAPGLGAMQINPDSFWPILDVVMRQQQAATALQKAAGVPDKDPDRAADDVRTRMAMSTMVQGWLPYLTADAGEEMIRRVGLQGEYKHVEPVADGVTRHCGKCGQEFMALPGAKTAVCDHCGHMLDVGAAEWPCNSCGGLVTLPAGESSTTCPYCKGLVDRVGR